jgi:hypothetical protein
VGRNLPFRFSSTSDTSKQGDLLFKRKWRVGLGEMVHICNVSYLRGRNQEDLECEAKSGKDKGNYKTLCQKQN